jgi:hypothetical protein
MVAVGLYLSLATVRRGAVPFFFEPGFFLFMSNLFLFAFVGLTAAAIVKRRETQWHRRLMFCGMATLTAPGWGRLLPMPLLIPWAGWVSFAAIMLFPIAGVIADLRRSGRVHPAWWWGIGVMVATQLVVVAIANSGLGLSIYELATQGSPGASVAPSAYPPSPAG